MHSHLPRTAAIKSMSRMRSIRERALTTSEVPAEVIRLSLSTDIWDADIIISLPMVTSIVDTTRRDRNNTLGLRIQEFIDIPEILKMDRAARPFFRFDSGTTDAGRFIIFSSEGKIVRFYKAGTFIMDGTFKVVPLPFYQLFLIHVFYLSRATPYIYVLMSNLPEFLY